MFLSTVSKFLSEDGTKKAVVWRVSASDKPFVVTMEGRGFSANVSHENLIEAEVEAADFCGIAHDAAEPAPDPKPVKASKKTPTAVEMNATENAD